MELRLETGGQETRFARAFRVLEEGIAARAFPGAAAGALSRGSVVALKGVGRFTYDAGSPAVTAGTIYDLASVTKAIATTTAAMILHERGLLDVDAPVAKYAPEFGGGGDGRRAEVTLRMLLAHSSGLPAYVKLFQSVEEVRPAASPHQTDGASRAAMVQAAMRTPLEAAPGTRAEYSDIGFIVLGEVLERIANEPLDRFCRREIFARLGMTRTFFNPPQELRSSIPPTEHDTWYRNRVIQGEVQDENAWAMGGVAGHAGLFAPAGDVLRFAQCMIGGGAPLVRSETLARFTRRESSGTSRALGWDTPSEPSQSGRHFGPRSFGHLGYAGTSLWIDPDQQLAVVLLTNRTWPDRGSQAIKRVRPEFHDAVAEGLR